MKKGALKSFADSKKLKYGTLNLILITFVIVIAILLNAIFTILSDALGWQLDMTEEQLYTVSDPLVELLGTVSQDVDVDIIFCCDKDRAQQSYSNLDSGLALAYVHSTATQIADRLDNVSVEYIDPIKDWEMMQTFTKLSTQRQPDENTVIVARKDAQGNYTTMYRTLHASSFYTFAGQNDGSKSLYGYNGERVFASAVLSLTYEKTPTVYFTTGHGEKLIESGSTVYLVELFRLCGFNVRAIDLTDKQYSCKTSGCENTWGVTVDLGGLKDSETVACEECGREYRKDEITKGQEPVERQIPENANAIVINQPKTDFFAGETSMLHHYLLEEKRTIMCFLDPTGNSNDNLAFENIYDFVEQETGVRVLGNSYVEDYDTSTGTGEFNFRGEVTDEDASSVYLSSLQGYGSARPIFENSGILEIDPKYLTGTGAYQSQANVLTQPLFSTSGNASFDGTVGKHSVMTISAYSSYVYADGTTSDAKSYFLVCPNGGFVEDENLISAKYVNDDILLSLVHSTTQKNVPVNLDFKTFANYELDITAGETRTALICLVTILPILTIAIGVVVLVRRKHR